MRPSTTHVILQVVHHLLELRPEGPIVAMGDQHVMELVEYFVGRGPCWDVHVPAEERAESLKHRGTEIRSWLHGLLTG